MKLTVVAATGRVGRLVLDQAVAAGHDVTAVARRPQGLPPGVRTVTADLSAPDRPTLLATLTDALAGADAVISGLGPRTRADAGVVEPGTRLLLEAAEAAGVRRFSMVSAAPIGTTPSPARPHPPRVDPGDDVLTGRVLMPVIKRVFRHVYTDLARAEDLVLASDRDWTIVRPPRLTDGPATGTYRTSTVANLPRGRTVSRADVADLMLRAVTDPALVRQIVRIAA
jgi:uncharacterized protein YbjT (DUF2867 family)